MKIGILGGGVAGLACSHYLAKAGHAPVVFEESWQLGGEAAPVEHRGLFFDRIHQPLLANDTAVCGLLAQLGAAGRTVWRETTSATLLDHRLYPWGRPADLLRMGALSPLARVRASAGLFYATSLKHYALGLDRTRAQHWLRKLLGEEACERLSYPFLARRYAEYTDDLPAYPVWHQLAAATSPTRGALSGGVRWMTEALRHSIESHGGQVLLHTEVTAVENGGNLLRLEIDGVEEAFDAVICTEPPQQLAKIARGHLVTELPALDLAYQGRVTVLVISRKPLEPYSQMDVIDGDLPFDSMTEASYLLPSRARDGLTLTYLTQYCAPHSERYRLSDDAVEKQAREFLSQMNPEFEESSVEATVITRTPLSDPIWSLGYLEQRPPRRIGDTRVFLCSSAQAYPRAPSWDTAVMQARETAVEVGRLSG